METEVFDTDDETTMVTIVVGEGTVTREAPVTVDDLKEVAKMSSIRKYTVQDGDGDELVANDFPVSSGTLKIIEYNEAKGL